MDKKIKFQVTAAELEIELMSLRGKVLSGCLTQSQARAEALSIGLHEMYSELDVAMMADNSLMSDLSVEIWLAISELEIEMGLHLCVPY